MSRKIIMCVGLPGSGKSFWVRELLDNSSTWKRVNRDSLRDMIDNGHWSQSKEKHIRQCELLLAEYFYQQGFNLICDDTNLSKSAQAMWQEFANKKGMTLEVKDFTDVPLEVCIKRDRIRPNSVGEKVIRKMHRTYLYKPPTPVPVDPELSWALLVDMDGTLALMGTRDPYNAVTCEEDLPNDPVIAMVQRSYHAGDSIIIVSGREEKYRPETERWLKRYLHVPYELLLMRPTGDSRPDFIVKREIYEGHIKGKYTIRLVLDDRDQMIRFWRDDLGFPAFQVADGDF